MFKLIKIDFYDEFSCLMANCPDNCCDEDWDIYIDEETIEKYKEMGIPDLDSKITPTEPHVIIKKNHKCPFITPEGLCTFHRDYGEEYLSNTCRSYPRFVSTYGDVYLETLGLSCPATVRCVLGWEFPMVFPERMYYESEDEKGRFIGRSEAEDMSRRVISRFEPGHSAREIYQTLTGKVTDTEKLILLLKDNTRNTPSEIYVNKLFNDSLIIKENELTDTERRIDECNRLFACNVNRAWLFEHIMLDSKSENPNANNIIIHGSIMWTLLVMSIVLCFRENGKIDEDTLTNCCYMIMRICDHGDSLLVRLSDGMGLK